MRSNRHIICIITLLSWHACSYTISVVYNLRIAQTTKRQPLPENASHNHVAGGTLFSGMRKTYNNTDETINGGLATLIYTPSSFYLRIDSALAQVHAKNKREKIDTTHTHWDDILCMFGYSSSLNNRTKITVSGLAGIPTHKDHNVQYFDFGPGHAGLGLQADGAYHYSADYHNNFYAAARLVHFFSRQATACIDNKRQTFDYNLGNLADLLVAHNSTWKHNALEVGYNATFAFAATIHPSLDSIVEKTNFIRSSFYSSYAHFFVKSKHPNALIIGLSYSFDQSPKHFGLQYGVTAWITWGLSF